MPQISSYASAGSVTGTDTLVGNVGGVTKQIPISILPGGSGGAIRQIKTTTTNTTFGTTSTTFATTGISATLAAAVATNTSKVRIRVAGVIGASATAVVAMTLFRGATNLTPAGADSMTQGVPVADYMWLPFSFEFTDTLTAGGTPTYTLYILTSPGATGYIGRRGLAPAGVVPTTISLEELN